MNDLLDLYYNESLVLCKENKLTDALKKMSKVFPMCQDRNDILNLLGLCYNALGEHEKSKMLWEKSLQINDDQKNVQEYLENIKSDDFKKYINFFNKAVKLSKEKKYTKSIRILNKIKDRSFCTVSYYRLLGLCYEGKGKRRKAIESFIEGLRLDKTNPELIEYLISRGRKEL